MFIKSIEEIKELKPLFDSLKSKIKLTLGGFAPSEYTPKFNKYYFTSGTVDFNTYLTFTTELAKTSYTLLDITDVMLEYLGIDYLLTENKDEFEFLHVTEPENEDSIQATGLQASTDWDGGLGKGVDLVKTPMNIDAYDNLAEFLNDYYDYQNADLLEIRGTYEGPYSEVILSGKNVGNHNGYIVVPEVSTDQIESYSITKLYNF